MFHFLQGHHYRAIIDAGALGELAHASEIQESLEQANLADLQVEKLEAYGRWQIVGLWAGESGEYDLPPEVIEVREVHL